MGRRGQGGTKVLVEGVGVAADLTWTTATWVHFYTATRPRTVSEPPEWKHGQYLEFLEWEKKNLHRRLEPLIPKFQWCDTSRAVEFAVCCDLSLDYTQYVWSG